MLRWMHTCAAFFRRYPAAWICVGLFTVVEVVARVAPVEYGMGAAVFLTQHRRNLVDSSGPDFDYIIFGESRSLSLLGHAPTGAENWSVYNLSLPAMGSRYYSYYLDKYLANRFNKPSALIFAGDMAVFQEGWNLPLHDPARIYTDSREDTLVQYLTNRIVRRPGQGLSPPASAVNAPQEAIWETYSHRYLFLFSPAELMRQFHGAERLFVLREAAPLQYYTFRYRDALRYFLSNPFPARPAPLPAECRQCGNSYAPMCRPDLTQFQDNVALAEGLDARYGQINLGDRLSLEQVMSYSVLRERLVKDTQDFFNRIQPDLRPLVALLETAKRSGVPVILAPTPTVAEYRDTRFYAEIESQLTDILARYPEAHRVDFAEPYLPAERFVDQIHYDCIGAEQVNADFYRTVMPRVLNIAPPAQGRRLRALDSEL